MLGLSRATAVITLKQNDRSKVSHIRWRRWSASCKGCIRSTHAEEEFGPLHFNDLICWQLACDVTDNVCSIWKVCTLRPSPTRAWLASPLQPTVSTNDLQRDIDSFTPASPLSCKHISGALTSATTATSSTRVRRIETFEIDRAQEKREKANTIRTRSD